MKMKKKKKWHEKPIKGYRANLLERWLGEKICSETKGKSHAKKGIAVNDVKEEIVNSWLKIKTASQHLNVFSIQGKTKFRSQKALWKTKII